MRRMKEQAAEYVVHQAEALASAESLQNESHIEHENPIREVGFAQIEHVISLDVELSDGAYRTYAVMHYFWQKKKKMWASTETIATLRGIKEQTILAHLRELIDIGLVARQKRLGQSSMIYLKDLPERYTAIASQILADRASVKDAKKQNSNMGKNTSQGSTKPSELRITIEEEPLKENHKEISAAKTAAPIIPTADERFDKEFNALKSVTAEDCAKAKTAHQEMLSALSEVCQIDLKLCAEKYVKEASRLLKADYTPAQVLEHYGMEGGWYRNDWRGQKGQPPDIRAINETIQRAVNGTWKQTNGGKQSIVDIINDGFALYDKVKHGNGNNDQTNPFPDAIDVSAAVG